MLSEQFFTPLLLNTVLPNTTWPNFTSQNPHRPKKTLSQNVQIKCIQMHFMNEIKVSDWLKQYLWGTDEVALHSFYERIHKTMSNFMKGSTLVSLVLWACRVGGRRMKATRHNAGLGFKILMYHKLIDTSAVVFISPKNHSVRTSFTASNHSQVLKWTSMIMMICARLVLFLRNFVLN